MFELVFPLMAGTGQNTIADATLFLMMAFAFLFLLSTVPGVLRIHRNN